MDRGDANAEQYQPQSTLVRIGVRNSTIYTSLGRAVLATSPDGFVFQHKEHGLWVHQCRMLSRYRWLINGTPVSLSTNSNIHQHSWLGYYIAAPADAGRKGFHEANPSQETIELRLSRQVGPGLHEDVELTNFTQFTTEVRLQLELESDFADPKEAGGKRRQHGQLRRTWHNGRGTAALTYDYRTRHAYNHQGDRGTARLHRGIRLELEHGGTAAKFRSNKITFSVRLKPHQSWRACLKWIPQIENKELPIESGCEFSGPDAFAAQHADFLEHSAMFFGPSSGTLTDVVVGALEQSRHDLASLRLYDLDHGKHAWVPAAGLPLYVSLFGRDSLVSGRQALLLSPELLAGSTQELARWQGAKCDDWRDEQPGKIVHEMHTSPLSVLNFDPHGRYYGGVTGGIYFGSAVAGLWHWTGNRDLVRSLVPVALRGLQWADRYGDVDGDGFCEYLTRSRQGEKNQGWKDSNDAIVYEDGSIVPDPLGTCEMQAFLYASKLELSEVLWDLGEGDVAKRLHHEAEELKKRFNEKFWMDAEGYIAMGLDKHKRQIRSIASDPGHCIASGIVDTERAPQVAKRLMAEDMFSGWGVRTLSADHPAFNPYAYHRGTVWPVENAVFAMGFARYGLHDLMHRLAAAQFEAASLFDYYRLPEVFAGHARDQKHPFPGMYPNANWPQAWSATAVFTLVQALLGIYPYAPLKTLLVDPHLPAWLPEITVRRMRVGGATISMRFVRKDQERTEYEILDQRGQLLVVRQSSPWSLAANSEERERDAIESLIA